MPITLDPDIALVLTAQAEQIAAMGGIALPERDDPLALRAFIDSAFKASHAPAAPHPT